MLGHCRENHIFCWSEMGQGLQLKYPPSPEKTCKKKCEIMSRWVYLPTFPKSKAWDCRLHILQRCSNYFWRFPKRFRQLPSIEKSTKYVLTIQTQMTILISRIILHQNWIEFTLNDPNLSVRREELACMREIDILDLQV